MGEYWKLKSTHRKQEVQMLAVLQQSCISGKMDPSKKSKGFLPKQYWLQLFNCTSVAPIHLKSPRGWFYALQLLTRRLDSTLDFTQGRFILKQMTRNVMLGGWVRIWIYSSCGNEWDHLKHCLRHNRHLNKEIPHRSCSVSCNYCSKATTRWTMC